MWDRSGQTEALLDYIIVDLSVSNDNCNECSRGTGSGAISLFTCPEGYENDEDPSIASFTYRWYVADVVATKGHVCDRFRGGVWRESELSCDINSSICV